MPDSRQINTRMPNEDSKHSPKDAEKPDVGKKDRMGENDGVGAETPTD